MAETPKQQRQQRRRRRTLLAMQALGTFFRALLFGGRIGK